MTNNNKTAPAIAEISRAQFTAYELVRESGVTNMFDIATVVALTAGALTKDDCLAIMRNYAAYAKRYRVKPEDESV